MKKTPSKPKENKTEDDEDTDKEEDEHKKSIVPKRKLNLDLSSKSYCRSIRLIHPFSI